MAAPSNIHALATLNDHLYDDTPLVNTTTATTTTQRISVLDDILANRRRRKTNTNNSDHNTVINTGNIGSRRYQRYINTIMSDADSTDTSGISDTSEIDECDLSIVSFQWKSLFHQVENEFYNDTATIDSYHNILHNQYQLNSIRHTPVNRAVERANRRAKKISLRSAGVINNQCNTVSLPSNTQYHSRHNSTTNNESSSNTAPMESIEFTSDSDDGDMIIVHTETSTKNQIHDSILSNELYMLVNKNLRHTYLGMHDLLFMTELESILIPYKSIQCTAKQLSTMHNKLHTIILSHQHSNILCIEFIDSFHVYLASGAIVYHQLHSTTDDNNSHILYISITQQSIHSYKLTTQIIESQQQYRLVQQQNHSIRLH